MSPQDDECHVVRHQKRGNPESRDPIRGTHVRRCFVERCEHYRGQQVQCALDVENQDEEPGASRVLDYGGNRSDGQHRSEQVAEGSRVGKLRRDAGVGGAGGQEHETEVPGRVQQEDRQQHRPW